MQSNVYKSAKLEIAVVSNDSSQQMSGLTSKMYI